MRARSRSNSEELQLKPEQKPTKLKSPKRATKGKSVTNSKDVKAQKKVSLPKSKIVKQKRNASVTPAKPQ